VRSITPEMRSALRAAGVATNDHFIGDASSAAYWTESELEAQLASLPGTGVTELMCHPGYIPEQVKSGYAAQREVELGTFLGARARSALGHAGLMPATYRVLHSPG